MESDNMVPDMKRIEREIKRISTSVITEIFDSAAKHIEAAWRKYPDFYKWIFGIK